MFYENITLYAALICFFAIEVTLKAFTNLFSFTIIGFIGTLAVFALLFGFYFCFKKKGKWIYATLIVLIMSILAMTQVLYKDYFGSFYSFSKISVLKEFWVVKGTSMGKFNLTYLIFLIFPLLTYLCGFLQKETSADYNKRSKLICIVAYECGAMALFGFNKFAIDIYSEKRETGDDYLYQTLYAKPRAVERFGFYLFEFRDLNRSLFHSNNVSNELDALMAENGYIHQENEYTGLLEGKNVILVLGESLSSYVIDPTLTPILYKMKAEGISFNNHYAPVMQAATSDSEFMALTGQFPSVDLGITAHDYKENKYPMALPYLFNSKGYVSTAFHGFKRGFYNRDIWMETYGFDNFYGEEDLKFIKQDDFLEAYNWNLDVDTFTQGVDYTDDLIKRKPFFDYFISVSGHMPYDSHRYELEPYLYEVYQTLGMPQDQATQDLYCYYAAQKSLDSALKGVMDNLTVRGLLEDTVIILFGDHYPYGLSDQGLELLFKEDLNTVQQYRTPFIIWTPGIKGVQVEEVTGTTDIYPTLANLFNLDITDTFVMGSDALSSIHQPVIFQDHSWINNDGYYDATKDIYTAINNELSDQEIEEISQMVNEKVGLSQELLQTNYYENH